MPDADMTLPGETSSVPTARHFVESILTAWGQPEHGWTAALLISELSANCALHARTSFTVRVELAGQTVRLSVTDGSARAPALRDYGSEATTGRGLQMVSRLASDWGVDRHEGGKTVWALIRADSLDDHRSDAAVEDLDGLLATLGEGGPGDADVVRLRAVPAPARRWAA